MTYKTSKIKIKILKRRKKRKKEKKGEKKDRSAHQNILKRVKYHFKLQERGVSSS